MTGKLVAIHPVTSNWDLAGRIRNEELGMNSCCRAHCRVAFGSPPNAETKRYILAGGALPLLRSQAISIPNS